ncbi:MAG TPA: preprotein translocase subunit SecG [Bryobacteraceae bacterium]|nr:preprotein translocase subunit SecG [Bryobacteraceae bacterium]
MIILLTIVHVIVCLFLIIVVLLQSGKAADLAGAFGGMGSQTAFGPRGAATVLSKATTIAAALFMITSLSLSVLASRNTGSVSTILDKPVQTLPTPKNPNEGKPSVTITPEGGGKGVTVPLPPEAPKPTGEAKPGEAKGDAGKSAEPKKK